jgi:hypothetical protein
LIGILFRNVTGMVVMMVVMIMMMFEDEEEEEPCVTNFLNNHCINQCSNMRNSKCTYYSFLTSV